MSIRDYKITDEQFNEKGMTSLPDTLNGTPYENKKSLEKFTREVVAPQFNAIVEVFARMEESTGNWSAEEAQRVQQENARQSAEQGRVSAEGQRKTSETARLSAEENRISAENDRVTAETARVNAENKRDSAEKSRVSAENARNVWQTYDAAKTYVPGNKVSFGGSSYVCTAATIGHEPTDTAYWLLIAQKGTDGAGADDLRQINNALDAIDPTKITTKAEPADGDGVMIADSADGGKAKRLLWSSVKTALGKLFVPLARKVNGKTLTEDVTLTGENIAVSTTDSTPISGAVKYRTNPNLLDNWYFGNPANQRGGYYVPQGAIIYSDSSLSEGSKIGAAAYAGPVVEFTNTYVKLQDVKFPTQYYYAAVSAAIPGYCTVGYTVDRWKLDIGEAVTLEDGCICLKKSGTYWGEYFDDFDQFIGMTLTGSVLLSDGTLRTGSFVYNGSVNQAQTFFSSELGFYVMKLSDSKTQCEINSLVDNVKIKAVKLELGDTQTLAHKENGVWVLNEIPDFGEQLRRCQEYFVRLGGHTNCPLGTLVIRETSKADVFVKLPVTMRTYPTLVSAVGEFFTIPYFQHCTIVGMDVTDSNLCALWCVPINSETFTEDRVYHLNCVETAHIDLSADL